MASAWAALSFDDDDNDDAGHKVGVRKEGGQCLGHGLTRKDALQWGGLLQSGVASSKDAIVVLIDVREPMFKKNEEGEVRRQCTLRRECI